jgi:hypothetical protein
VAYLFVDVFPRIVIAALSVSLFVLMLRAETSAIEREFARERKTLTCVNGSSDEPSCGGTDIDVYLRGEEICHLDWWVEMSNKWVREEYFFRGSQPVLVIETLEKKYDSHGELLPKPQLVSRILHRLDEAEGSDRRKKFLKHAAFLLRDFRERRSEFTPCVRPHI